MDEAATEAKPLAGLSRIPERTRMPRIATLAAFLLGGLTAIAWASRAVEFFWPCEYESPVRHRTRGDCG